ncbi:MAG: deoxyribose-phosphate aldolase [Chlamydiales bacterium]|nr:deoxyribose-phosphate aldolase [Chlamydiales bacterium]
MIIEPLSAKQIAGLCDHTFLTPTEAFRHAAKSGENPIALRRRAFEAFLAETTASPLKPYAICVAASDVHWVARHLPDAIIAATVGFPDGPRHSTAYTLAETYVALSEGAQEIDMVLDYDGLKNNEYEFIREDLNQVVQMVHRHSAILKLILEVSELTLEQTAKACELANEAGVDFVKTSTGFSASGATIEHLKVMRQTFHRGIKISGGVNLDNVHSLLSAATAAEQAISTDPQVLRIGESSLLKQLEALR